MEREFVEIKKWDAASCQTACVRFLCNLPQYVKDPYKRFLENKLRSKFDFTGCPVQIFMRQK